jgi:hypothetical protein
MIHSSATIALVLLVLHECPIIVSICNANHCKSLRILCVIALMRLQGALADSYMAVFAYLLL